VKQQMPPHVEAVCLRKRLDDVPQNQMGKWRDRTEALHAGNRTRTAKACATDSTPSLWWRITDQLRPIESEMVRKPGFAPGPSRSQREVLLLHHDPD
jgi:hypothetical protein